VAVGLFVGWSGKIRASIPNIAKGIATDAECVL